ncbi:hypothetical protein ACHAXT_007783 [Thalassiosira profunda]
MKSQHQRVVAASWGLMYLFVACALCCIRPGYFAHTALAATNGNPSTSTVRPLTRRVPFLPARNSRRAAKEAYLHHLQNELDAAQKQLYVSQNTCNTLRKRWEERQEILGRGAGTNVADQRKIQEQEGEIERLEGQLRSETQKQNEQVERLNLMAAELKELQAWKEQQSDTGNVTEYEQQLQESRQKENDYAEEVQLLALKLEAAEFAAKQNIQGGGDGKGTAWGDRAQALRAELENVRVKYSELLVSSIEQGGADRQGTLNEMDGAIQSAVESALESLEKGWEEKCDALETQLSDMTDHVVTVEAERDAALSRAEGALAAAAHSGLQEEDSNVLQMQQERLREELTAELTETLTEELTEKLTQQMTETLAKKMERKYKKKYKRLRKELQEQQPGQAEDDQQMLESEIAKVKEQCELEYEAKLQQLQKQSDEQVQFQKERMRKLVKALLEREAEKKGGTVIKKKKTATAKAKKTSDVAGDGGASMDNESAEEEAPASSVSSSRKRARSRRIQ